MLPLTAVQILWIDLVTAVGLRLVLAVEPKERGIMTRPPRLPGTPVLDRALVVRVLLVGLLLTGVAFAAWTAAVAVGSSEAEARTVALHVFVLVEIAYLLTCRSLRDPLPRSAWFANRWLVAGIAVVLALQVVVTAAPGATDLLGTVWPTTAAWAVVAATTTAGSAAVWITVALTRRRGDSGATSARQEHRDDPRR